MAICQLTLTRVAVVAALAYICYNMFTFYTIFFPPQCQLNQRDRCVLPAHTKDTRLEVSELGCCMIFHVTWRKLVRMRVSECVL